MLDVQVSRFSGVRPRDEGVFADGETGLECLRFLVKVAPAWQDYRAMVDACGDAAQPLTDKLHDQGFRIWLLLVGARLTAERKLRYPNYSLARPADDLGLLTEHRIEHVFVQPGVEQTAGLYRVELCKFREACWFTNTQAWSVLVLSRRDKFLSEDNLARVHDGGRSDGEGNMGGFVYWRHLAKVVCPLGDVVVKTHGTFDDKERSINFVYDSPRDEIQRLVSQF